MFLLDGRRVFRDFLKYEYSEENMMFWLACQELKKETRPESIENKVRMIYNDYISVMSPKEVSRPCEWIGAPPIIGVITFFTIIYYIHVQLNI